ncbi:putative NADH-ubiquinone oxidoreductase 30.4 kDa subunit, mitochondrial [Serendipita sp. 405]|nr:putative NADH-ubiquinone oxidoreductase 30.4 kDa subunit, mitochondrial [Serendipita sp. 405]
MYARLARHGRVQALRIATRRLPVPFRALSVSSSRQVSSPPFPEQTSKNPATTTYKDVSGSLHSYGAYLLSCLPKFIQQFSVVRDELTLYVAPSALKPTLLFLRDHTNCQFKQLVDISGADYPSRDKRFEVVYHLLSVRYQSRIRVKTYADEVQGVPSAVEVFNSANWYEREVWDLYGVWFIDHPDL